MSYSQVLNDRIAGWDPCVFNAFKNKPIWRKPLVGLVSFGLGHVILRNCSNLSCRDHALHVLLSHSYTIARASLCAHWVWRLLSYSKPQLVLFHFTEATDICLPKWRGHPRELCNKAWMAYYVFCRDAAILNLYSSSCSWALNWYMFTLLYKNLVPFPPSATS